jgi:hypothetical protein
MRREELIYGENNPPPPPREGKICISRREIKTNERQMKKEKR